MRSVGLIRQLLAANPANTNPHIYIGTYVLYSVLFIHYVIEIAQYFERNSDEACVMGKTGCGFYRVDTNVDVYLHFCVDTATVICLAMYSMYKYFNVVLHHIV